MNISGQIFNIQHYSLHDGPGIRTTVFFSGCNLRCAWCHNPESFTKTSRLQFFPALCSNCRKCLEVCKHSVHSFSESGHTVAHNLCTACGECVKVCRNNALLLTGRTASLDEIMTEILSDKLFYKVSGGGATLSGGEPLLQPDFAVEILRECKKNGIHTAVESALSVPWNTIKSVIPHTDLFLADFKLANTELHKRYTGVSNELILENIWKLDSAAGCGSFSYCIRFPYIPQLHNTEENIKELADILQPLNHLSYVEPLRFHRMASAKYESLGLDYPAERFDFTEPDAEMLTGFAKKLQDAGMNVFVDL